MNEVFEIGPACPEDAADLLKIHAAAVHQTAAPFYSQAIIHSWSRLLFTPERVEKVRERWIEDPDLYTAVARQGDRPVGFGLISNRSELGALYVHPDFGRRGIGGGLIAALEQAARERGLLYLTANASLNAKAFYQKQGFEVLGPTTFRLTSGLEMPCVKIRKDLDWVRPENASSQ
jgi:putative acetyltransferase